MSYRSLLRGLPCEFGRKIFSKRVNLINLETKIEKPSLTDGQIEPVSNYSIQRSLSQL